MSDSDYYDPDDNGDDEYGDYDANMSDDSNAYNPGGNSDGSNISIPTQIDNLMFEVEEGKDISYFKINSYF